MEGNPPQLSACIIARDEEDRIEPCLASLAWCDEILVVDARSTDRTREIAAAHGARVIEREWPGHVAQKEFAIRQAQHDWVLCVDADERVSPDLRAEIEALREAGFPGHAGWRMPRLSSYLGRWIRHGSWYPDRQLRLFDRRRGRWAGRDPHDRVELDGPVGTLRGRLLHHPYRDLADHLDTIDRYTSVAARRLREEGRRARLVDIALRPVWRFLRFYLLEAGFLEGWRGLVMAYLAAHYVRLRYLKLWLLERGSQIETPPDRNGRRPRSTVWSRTKSDHGRREVAVSLLRFLGLGASSAQSERRETQTVRRIADQLERLPPEQAKYLASFAFVLARVAHADLEFEDSELAEMERIVREIAHLSEAEAALVVQIAKSQAQHLGGTENYVVTREFRQLASREQRAELLQCVYAVAAADGTISSVESNEILRIAEELGFTRPEANALRSAYKEKLSEFQ